MAETGGELPYWPHRAHLIFLLLLITNILILLLFNLSLILFNTFYNSPLFNVIMKERFKLLGLL